MGIFQFFFVVFFLFFFDGEFKFSVEKKIYEDALKRIEMVLK